MELIQILFALLVFGCIAKITAKAGYPWWFSLAMLVPFLNIFALVWFAFTDWPLEEQAYLYRMQEADDELRDPAYLAKRWVKKAVRLESEGRIDEAIRLYEKLAAGSQPGIAELSEIALARLRARDTSAIRPGFPRA